MNRELFYKYSSNKAKTDEILNYIEIVGRAVKKVFSRPCYEGLPMPCIAGGSLRDAMFGLDFKDIDIFCDTSHLPEGDERDEFTLLLTDDIIKECRKEGLPGVDTGGPFQVTGNDYEATDSSFSVYESYFTHGEWGPTYGIQVIGRPDGLLAISPFSLVENFDYSLCKAAFNIETNCLEVDPTFLESLSTGVVQFTGSGPVKQQTLDRVTRFVDKAKRADIEIGLPEYEAEALPYVPSTLASWKLLLRKYTDANDF